MDISPIFLIILTILEIKLLIHCYKTAIVSSVIAEIRFIPILIAFILIKEINKGQIIVIIKDYVYLSTLILLLLNYLLIFIFHLRKSEFQIVTDYLKNYNINIKESDKTILKFNSLQLKSAIVRYIQNHKNSDKTTKEKKLKDLLNDNSPNLFESLKKTNKITKKG